MREFDFKGGCGGHCHTHNLCGNCVEAWSCQVKYENLEAENAELKKALAAIIEITHNNYDHDTQRIYKIAKEASNDM